MIKILINNEEVVSNSNLQINEEMLSTSSTILKNCYPKSWELDKDYVSRYYFPKDYAKCKIFNVEEDYSGINLLNTNQGYRRAYWDDDNNYISTGATARKYCYYLADIPVQGGETYCFSLNTQVYEIIVVSYNDDDGFNRQKVENASEITYTIPEDHTTMEVMFNYDNATNITNAIAEEVQAMVQKRTTRLNPYKQYGDNTPTLIDTLIFCGCVKNTGNISLNPREPHYVDLQILDFKTLLSEGETLNYVISDKTILEAINQVIDSIADYGFVLGNINIQNQDDKIGAYSTLDKTAYDVFQYIAEITQSRWTTRMIDENTVAIDFFDPLLEGIKDTIESTEEYYEDNNIVDISFNYSTNDYRNKQIMTSDAVIGSIIQSENKVSDGYNKTFILDNNIGYFDSITINGVLQSVITKAQKELGYDADFVFTPGENTIVSSNTITAGVTIIFNYYPIVRGREIIINPGEISRISTQTNRNGAITRYENRNDTTSSIELAKIGQSYIKYKGNAEITLKVKSTKDLFNVGDLIRYDSLVDDLDTIYMVKSKIIDMYISANEIFYTYELTSNYNSENAINYFDNQRAKLNGNLGEGETIIRDIDIENSELIIFYDTNIQEITLLNPTELDFALDGVLI